MDYKLLLAFIFMFVGLSSQRDERLTAFKESALRRLALRTPEKLKLDGEFVGPFGGKFRASLHADRSASGNRGRLRLNGEYSGLLGDARARISADRRNEFGRSGRRLDVEGAVRGLLGGVVEGRFLSDARKALRPLGTGIRRKLEAGISARRPSGAAVGARGSFVGGLDAGLTGVAGEMRGGLEGGVRGPFGAGASGGFDGGFRGSVGLPIFQDRRVVRSRRFRDY